jgi:hypothetical protein
MEIDNQEPEDERKGSAGLGWWLRNRITRIHRILTKTRWKIGEGNIKNFEDIFRYVEIRQTK